MKNLRFFLSLCLLACWVSMAAAQVFSPVPNIRIFQIDPVDPTQAWAASDNLLQKGSAPTATAGFQPTLSIQITGRPTSLSITPAYALMQVTNLDGSQADNPLVTVDLGTTAVRYSNLVATGTFTIRGTSSSFTTPFSGGGSAALADGTFILGAAVSTNPKQTGGAKQMFPKLALYNAQSGVVTSYYDDDTLQGAFSIYCVPGTTKCAVTYIDQTTSPQSYDVAVVDTANMDAEVSYIPVSFTITYPPQFIGTQGFMTGNGVGATVDIQSLNVASANYLSNYLDVQSTGDTTYLYAVQGSVFYTLNATTGAVLQEILVAAGQQGPFPQMWATRDSSLNLNHVLLFEQGKGLFSMDLVRPPTAANAVVNSFSYQAGPVTTTTLGTITGNEWVTIFGRELAKAAVAASGTLPAQLNGTSVTLQCAGAKPVALVNYVSPNQINALTPPTLSASTCPLATLVTTTTFGDGTSVSSAPVQLSVVASALGVLQDQTSGSVWVVHPSNNYAVNHQAAPGEIVTLYGTGGGATQPCPANSTLQCVTATPSITIGGFAADILFFGLQPTDAGLNQINIQVPVNAPTGINPIPISITMGTAPAPEARVVIAN